MAAALLLALVATSCGSPTVFDNIDSGGAITGDTLADPGVNPATITYSLEATAAVTATIDSAGGEIKLSRDGVEMSLVVPEGALANPVDITLTPVVNAKSDLVDLTVGVQFSPAGLLLAKPGYLKLEGESTYADLMAVTWDESGGEVVRSMTLPTIGQGIRIPIAHFSGAGAGTAGSNETNFSPSSRNQRALDLMSEQWNADGKECVAADSPAGVTALNYYASDAREDVIPALIAAQTDDLALLDATRKVLNWWSFPLVLKPLTDSAFCEDLVEAYEELKLQFSDEIGARLKAGYTHAMYEASRQCKARTDLGEIKHMAQWYGKALFLMSIPAMDDVPYWSSLLTDVVEACALYRVELRTQISLEAGDAGRIRGTIAAVAVDVPDSALAERFGFNDEDQQFPFGDPSYRLELPRNSDGCVYEDGSELDSIVGRQMYLGLTEPERRIPELDGIASEANDSGGEDSTTKAGSLVLFKLTASGTVVVHCGDTTVPFPVLAKIVPGWFNRANSIDPESSQIEFDLETENSGRLVASYTNDEPIVDPTDPSSEAEQHTEIKVFLTPKSPRFPEPPPPSVPFDPGDSEP